MPKLRIKILQFQAESREASKAMKVIKLRKPMPFSLVTTQALSKEGNAMSKQRARNARVLLEYVLSGTSVRTKAAHRHQSGSTGGNRKTPKQHRFVLKQKVSPSP